jgi:hypothetical protein
MNKLATAFKFGTVSLVVAAAVQCSSYSSKDLAQDSTKDALQGASQGQIHEVKDVTQDAEGKIHGVKDVSKNLAKHLSKNLV